VNRRAAILACAVSLAFFALAYSLRTYAPYPRNYTTRLVWLSGWYAPGFFKVNCSGFLANAHGDGYLDPADFARGVDGKMELVGEWSTVAEIDEHQLRRGDVGYFPAGHVAAYLGNGEWIDADVRRGGIAKYRMSSKVTDPWFAGSARILRWKGMS
jgi:hypothetical protein